MILQILVTLPLCFGAGLVREGVAREIVCRIVFAFHQLNSRVKTLQLEPCLLDSGRRLTLRLFHHGLQGLRIYEVNEMAALKKHLEACAPKEHRYRLTFQLSIFLFGLIQRPTRNIHGSIEAVIIQLSESGVDSHRRGICKQGSLPVSVEVREHGGL